MQFDKMYKTKSSMFKYHSFKKLQNIKKFFLYLKKYFLFVFYKFHKIVYFCEIKIRIEYLGKHFIYIVYKIRWINISTGILYKLHSINTYDA